MVYKEYKPGVLATVNRENLAKMPDFLEGLGVTRANKLIDIAAWPCAVVSHSGTTRGFVMPAIPDRFFIELNFATGRRRVAAEVQHLMNPRQVDLNRGLVISDRQRVEVLGAIADAVSTMHSYGITIGDISPKNLLFSLKPSVAAYFIDTDAMKVGGRTVAQQMETPGWTVPAGEPLATVQSDLYKLGLLVLRILQRGAVLQRRDVADHLVAHRWQHEFVIARPAADDRLLVA